MTMQSGTILRQYIDILNEAPEPIAPTASNVKVPPIPKLPAQDGDQGDGSVVNTNSDGTRSYAGAFGRFTYDKSGKAIKYASPQLTSVGREVDLASGDLTTNYNAGPMSVSQTQTPGGYTKQSDMQTDLGTATLGQKTVGPDIAAGQLAGTTTNTVTNNQTGQAVQQVQGVGFGGASGANVGKNYVGASTADLAQNAANSTVGINPDDAATTPQARVAPAVSPTAPKTEKDVVDLNAKYNKKKPASESMSAGVRFQRALEREKEKRERSERYAEKNFPIGKKPEPQKEVKEDKSFLEHVEEVENDGPLTSGDYFHIELSEDEGIETWVIAEWSDSVLIEADGATLRLLEESGITFQDELTEAEYQGRSVPLGKRMAGDVKKSKVYVKKPNGKVVKVNFGDKNMTIKKSNPARRRSFRARHNCANPGPRWRARYWSCRAW